MNDDSKPIEGYRQVLVTANKLETIHGNLDSVIDFFSSPLVKLYSKLLNDCLSLLFGKKFKLDYFRKAEELVWKRVYHDLYRFQKTKKLPVRQQDECLIESHFISGIGFYSNLIVKLRYFYGVHDVQGLTEPLAFAIGPIDNFSQTKRLIDEDALHPQQLPLDPSDSHQDVRQDDIATKQWARLAIYRSMVYMGDLARYLLENSKFDSRNLAFEFYRAASLYQPDHGLPFNQLATLAGGQNHNLDAVCSYMRCCSRDKPFEGAEGNMKKIFELNQKFYEDLIQGQHIPTMADVLSHKEPLKSAESLMRAVIVMFIKLTSDLWMAINDNEFDMMQDALVSETRSLFEILREAIELDPIIPLDASNGFAESFSPISSGSNSPEKPRHLSATIMYEFCSISIMLATQCYKRRQVGSKSPEQASPLSANLVDLVNTLALNLLHYASSKCQKTITSKVHELRIAQQEISLEGTKNYVESFGSECGIHSNDRHRSSDNILSLTPNRRTMSRQRQKKAATNYSGTGLKAKQTSAHNDDSDMSELEETALSTIDALEISSGVSEDADYEAEDLINLDSSSESEGATSKSQPSLILQTSDRSLRSRFVLRPTRSQNYESSRKSNFSDLGRSDFLADDVSQIHHKSISHLSLNSNVEFNEPLASWANASTNSQSDSGFLDNVFGYIYNQTYLPTIKIFFDWLLSNGNIIDSNLNSFQDFHHELEDIINLLRELMKMAGLGNQTTASGSGTSSLSSSSYDEHAIFDHIFNGPDWTQRYPLSCDYPLLGLFLLRSVHETNINFKFPNRLNDAESGFITIQCVEAFFHALTAFLAIKSG